MGQPKTPHPSKPIPPPPTQVPAAPSSALPISSSTRSIKTCRICLEDATSSGSGDFIQPCLCSGSVRAVHEACLREWINTILAKEQKENKKTKAHCEICKEEFDYTVRKKIVCLSKEDICLTVRSDLSLLRILIGMVIFLLLAIGALLYLQLQVLLPSSSLITLVIVGYIMCGLCILVLATKLVICFCLDFKK
jgi:hypothetical protein